MKTTATDIKWQVLAFNELSAELLYKLLQLRAEVFIVEQNCPYQDLDGKDLKSHHLLGFDADQRLIAYSRILPAQVSYGEASIGRVVSSPSVRGTGAGRKLMERSLQAVDELFGKVPVRIGAQLYLERFYEGFGFRTEGEPYMEDGIPHIIMLRDA